MGVLSSWDTLAIEVPPHPVDLLQLRRHRVESSGQLSHLVPGGGGNPLGVVAPGHGAGRRSHLP